MGNVRTLAAAVYTAVVAQQQIAPDLLTALTDAILADAPEVVRLAMAVREGGPHATRRAIELAALILAAGDEQTANDAPPMGR